MKANELRHGNIVKHIESISDYHVFVGSYDQYAFLKDWFMDDVYLEELQPIPLTEKWLLDLGFEKKSRIDIGELKPCFAIFSFAVMVRHNSYFIDWIGGNTEVKHVHQLQNLYFALTGQELTLKENK